MYNMYNKQVDYHVRGECYNPKATTKKIQQRAIVKANSGNKMESPKVPN